MSDRICGHQLLFCECEIKSRDQHILAAQADSAKVRELLQKNLERMKIINGSKKCCIARKPNVCPNHSLIEETEEVFCHHHSHSPTAALDELKAGCRKERAGSEAALNQLIEAIGEHFNNCDGAPDGGHTEECIGFGEHDDFLRQKAITHFPIILTCNSFSALRASNLEAVRRFVFTIKAIVSCMCNDIIDGQGKEIINKQIDTALADFERGDGK